MFNFNCSYICSCVTPDVWYSAFLIDCEVKVKHEDAAVNIYDRVTSLVSTDYSSHFTSVPHPPLVDFSKFNLVEENICPLVAPLGIPRIFSKGRMGILVRIRHLDRLFKLMKSTTLILCSWKALFLWLKHSRFCPKASYLSIARRSDLKSFSYLCTLLNECCACQTQRLVPRPRMTHTGTTAYPSVITPGVNTWIIRYV